MLNIDEINKEILMLETKRDTTYSTIEKLAPLYIVRDHFDGGIVNTPTPIKIEYGNSEFLQAIENKDSRQVFDIIDELLDAIKVTNSKLYSAVLQKIEQIEG